VSERDRGVDLERAAGGNDAYSLSAANEDLLEGALSAAWKLRVEKNGKTSPSEARQVHAGEQLRRSQKEVTSKAETGSE